MNSHRFVMTRLVPTLLHARGGRGDARPVTAIVILLLLRCRIVRRWRHFRDWWWRLLLRGRRGRRRLNRRQLLLRGHGGRRDSRLTLDQASLLLLLQLLLNHAMVRNVAEKYAFNGKGTSTSLIKGYLGNFVQGSNKTVSPSFPLHLLPDQSDACTEYSTSLSGLSGF